MKTLFLYTDSDIEFYFFEKIGDYRHLHNHVVNGDLSQKQSDEIVEITENITNEEKLYEPTKDWDYFVKIGWIL